MSLWLIVALALLTYLSRAASLALLPKPSPGVERVVSRVPAPLFAAFSASSLLTSSRDTASVEAFTAVLVAVAVAVATRTRSLLVILAAGLGGYLVATGVRALV